MRHGEKPSLYGQWKLRYFNLQSRFLNLLFPIRCVNCNALGVRICPGCLPSIQWVEPPFCNRCGLPGPVIDNHTCIDIHLLRHIRSAAIYSGPIRKALHALKYRQDRSLAGLLVKESLSHWPVEDWKVNFLLPVPMGSRRFRERGYNQAELIADAVSESTGIPKKLGILTRIRDTKSQVGLSQRERQLNLEAAFLSHSVHNLSILLVDDVCTTGSTLVACSQALRAAGASAVYAITIARAVTHPNAMDSKAIIS
jgi:ComF family protein